MHLPTAARLVGKSFRYPFRAVRNGIGAIKFSMLDLMEERERLFAFLSNAFDADTDRFQREFETSQFKQWTQQRRQDLAEFKGPYRFGSTGEWDCEALYYLVRASKPRTVVETGVCYGASSSYILEALARNGSGHLYSIDLGNTPDEPTNDFFVHPAHRSHWHLRIGDSKAVMPPLLERLGQIDLFHHDSLHTYEHMMWEYTTAFRHLSPTGALSSDDVGIILKLREPFRRSPFADFCDAHGWTWQGVRNFGMAVNGSREIAQLRRQRIHSTGARGKDRFSEAPTRVQRRA